MKYCHEDTTVVVAELRSKDGASTVVWWPKLPPLMPTPHMGTCLSPSYSTSDLVPCQQPGKAADGPGSLVPTFIWETKRRFLAPGSWFWTGHCGLFGSDPGHGRSLCLSFFPCYFAFQISISRKNKIGLKHYS